MENKDIKSISDIIVYYCHNKGFSITPLKLQKLLYFVQAWHIVKFNRNTLFNELPEAWVNGPVYRSVYKQYADRFYRNDYIKADYDEEQIHLKLQCATKTLKLEPEQEKLIFDVLDVYGPMTEQKLVYLTHVSTPWNNARKGLSPIERCTIIISVDDIYNYYTRKK